MNTISHRRNALDRHHVLACLLALCISCVIGCGVNLGPRQQAPESQTYTLEYPPPQPKDVSPLPGILRVEAFESIPIYRSDNIVYREGAFRRESYRYHKWQTPPSEMITFLLIRDFRAAGAFKAVLSPNSLLAPTLTLEGGIEEFLEEATPKGWIAVVTLNATLTSEYRPGEGRTALFQRTYSEREPCRANTPGALSEAMSRAMSRISAQILNDIYQVAATR
ncbi:hypothetical protein D3OALGA1CA_4828 [Olavius algarvensis associated proteobacterium Delta 3]|nr:hypothetical protein D3OALGA1CA_4828 [Olavius algarvensis associated proteobacterium Delta 3]